MDNTFPAAKLGGLLVRQLSAPIAARIKIFAVAHPVFRRIVCVPLARFHHRTELRYKMWLLKLGKPVIRSPLSERQSVELAGDILGEAIIFFIGATVITLEVMRQAAKQEVKAEKEVKRWQGLVNAAEDIRINLAGQQKDIDRLLEILQKSKK